MVPYVLVMLVSLVVGYAFTRWLIDDERRVASNRPRSRPDDDTGEEQPPGRMYRTLRTVIPTLAFGLLAGATLCALLWSSGILPRAGG